MKHLIIDSQTVSLLCCTTTRFYSFIRTSAHCLKKKFLISMTLKDGGIIFLMFTRDQPSGIGPAIFLRVSSVEWDRNCSNEGHNIGRSMIAVTRPKFRIRDRESFSMKTMTHIREIANVNGMNIELLAYLFCAQRCMKNYI